MRAAVGAGATIAALRRPQRKKGMVEVATNQSAERLGAQLGHALPNDLAQQLLGELRAYDLRLGVLNAVLTNLSEREGMRQPSGSLDRDLEAGFEFLQQVNDGLARLTRDLKEAIGA